MTDVYDLMTRRSNADIAAGLADGLRRLADFIEAHPVEARLMERTFSRINVPVMCGADSEEAIREFGLAAWHDGLAIENWSSEKFGGAFVRVSPDVRVNLYADRDLLDEPERVVR